MWRIKGRECGETDGQIPIMHSEPHDSYHIILFRQSCLTCEQLSRLSRSCHPKPGSHSETGMSPQVRKQAKHLSRCLRVMERVIRS